ncbi:MAG: EAL and HDOD domain-containing protein [Dissulfurimicrobium sp.]|uniref:EAL and HDOD domain-containing protein n=1 Tax=Dissulfurimicrobium TaxID=1769732 RepID=UPI003C764651
MEIYVGRQPILNSDRETVAYELLYRSGEKNAFPGMDGTAATSNLINNAFYSMDINEIVGGKRLFVNFTRELLLSGPPMLDPNKVVIEILEDVLVDEALIQALKALAHKGFKLALDDFVLNEASRPLIPLADYIKVDWRASSKEETGGIIDAARQAATGRNIKLLAEKIETYEEFRQALNLGFTCFQGYFFARPSVIKGKDLSPGVWSMLRLMTAVQGNHLDINEISDIITKDPALCYKLLKVVNVAAVGLRQPVSSVKQAIVLLGEIEIRRWISVLLLAHLSADKPTELMKTACVRASFGERLAKAAGQADLASNAFFMGLFSLMDAVLERPIEKILKPLPLAPAVSRALIDSKGPLAPYLEFMLAYEQGHLYDMARLMDALRINDETAIRCYLEAVKWADKGGAAAAG